ncbi:hypothetical protein, partial [Falsiroseomonas oryzae]|uniref:hypothetical protein n=1 Tax=Falsiroseomonas oryzae TaxID=2766473 RepID=UPI0022EA528B
MRLRARIAALLILLPTGAGVAQPLRSTVVPADAAVVIAPRGQSAPVAMPRAPLPPVPRAAS